MLLPHHVVPLVAVTQTVKPDGPDGPSGHTAVAGHLPYGEGQLLIVRVAVGILEPPVELIVLPPGRPVDVDHVDVAGEELHQFPCGEERAPERRLPTVDRVEHRLGSDGGFDALVPTWILGTVDPDEHRAIG